VLLLGSLSAAADGVGLRKMKYVVRASSRTISETSGPVVPGPKRIKKGENS
jgi:hypothetical protein